ncbi:MAG: hypothetical protein AAGC56_00695 [Pseudomonadota bacterium]
MSTVASRRGEPLQNRVTPFGAIVADRARGAVMGNRGGRLHDPETQTLGRRRWASKRWIYCGLNFKGRRRTVMGAGYTELFFADIWTALAAGHRPCFECRRDEARAFAAAFGRATGAPRRADAIDARLHCERRHRERMHRERLEREQPDARRATALVGDLPDGAMVARDAAAFLCERGRLRRWRSSGYDAPETPPSFAVEVLTPPSVVAVLRAGWRPGAP